MAGITFGWSGSKKKSFSCNLLVTTSLNKTTNLFPLPSHMIIEKFMFFLFGFSSKDIKKDVMNQLITVCIINNISTINTDSNLPTYRTKRNIFIVFTCQVTNFLLAFKFAFCCISSWLNTGLPNGMHLHILVKFFFHSSHYLISLNNTK